MSKIVRASKYRHVFGEVAKKENCFDELKPTKTAWDSDYVAVNPLFWAVMWDSAGGGSFVVNRLDKPGKILANHPQVAGHKAPVQDLEFHPFNDNLIASVSEDCYGKIWNIPTDGLTDTLTEPVQSLRGHKRKVGTCSFNPIANHILATSGADFAVKVWDVEKGEAVLNIEAKHADIIQACKWSHDGALLATTCKDKKLRIFDPRTSGETLTGEGICHEGVKGSRCIWLGEKEKIFTTGFSKTSQREFAIWDPKDLSKPLLKVNIDSSSGILIPYFDSDTSVLYLAGRGDGNIRYYEIATEEASPIQAHFLSEFKSATPLKGIGWLPKRAVDVSTCEINRAYKLSNKLLEPIAFIVPRKSDIFQDDLYPNCFSGEPTLTQADWFSGKKGTQKTQSMEGGFVFKEKKTDFNPVVAEEKELSPDEMKAEIERLTARVNFLEAEAVKKDAKIKELGGNA